MILRRLSQSLKEQNWMAICIEFVLLVVGVFLGIQVANWNTDRQNRALAQGYLQRLHHEVVDLIDDGAEAALSSEELNHQLQQVQAYLSAGAGVKTTALGQEHCSAIGRSHIYARGIILPPTLGELLATGRVLLIDDESLRTSIASFAMAAAAASSSMERMSRQWSSAARSSSVVASACRPHE